MVKKIKVVDVTPDEPIQELEQPSEQAEETHVEEIDPPAWTPPSPPPPPPPKAKIPKSKPIIEVESESEEAPPPPPPKKIAKSKTVPVQVVESESEEEVAPPPKKKIPKAKSEPIVKVTTLIPCQKCGKRMTAKSLKYSHVCGNVAAAKTAPKPKPKPQPTPKAEAREEVTQPIAYHDIVKQRVQQMREQRQQRIQGLFSRAV